jgi:hypothetical protein
MGALSGLGLSPMTRMCRTKALALHSAKGVTTRVPVSPLVTPAAPARSARESEQLERWAISNSTQIDTSGRPGVPAATPARAGFSVPAHITMTDSALVRTHATHEVSIRSLNRGRRDRRAQVSQVNYSTSALAARERNGRDCGEWCAGTEAGGCGSVRERTLPFDCKARAAVAN